MTAVVLLTRPEGGNEALARALRESGITVRICPAVELVPVMSGEEIVEVWTQWRERAVSALVAITSAETVKLLRAAGVSVDVPVAAVGPASAEAVRAAGWDCLDLVASAAASLADALIDAGLVEDRDVWLPQSAHASAELTGRLEAAGARVTATSLYEPVARTLELRDALSEGNVDVAAFFSGSAVRAFADAAPQWSGHAVCIGASTAAVATEHGWGKVSVASAPTDEAVMRLILALVAPTGKAG